MRRAIVIVGALVLLICIGVAFYGRHPNLPRDITDAEPAIQVRVVAKQYSWLFHYPGTDALFGNTDEAVTSDSNPLGLDSADPSAADDKYSEELVLPCDSIVQLILTSTDLIHSLGDLPGVRNLDVIPGVERPTPIETLGEPTVGILRCVQLCGEGHENHKAPYRFVTPHEYRLWLTNASTSGDQTEAEQGEEADAENAP